MLTRELTLTNLELSNHTFIRNNVHPVVQADVQANEKNILSDNERIVYEMIKANRKIQKLELSVAINKGEKNRSKSIGILDQTRIN